ncbi:uncharacterized protein LOC115456597 isoform X3 [Microcaecilia unicolor]|uniref:Uncharacterized protein LOC115456597 isoform X3 n=1 Tax=Microcaecilia unicolor TaxID=1415580 RepID=A0A6P7WTW0_9AMPH|nr:uncharacterized protein LOC115456597 isoform X3 [Microcaecilia unicolor]
MVHPVRPTSHSCLRSAASSSVTIPSILHQSENGEYPLPNLAPRHQELIPTPLGPIKPWSELSWPIRGYFCLTISSLVVVLGLTIMNMTTQQGEDFSISLIQLIGIVFCMYYVTRAILQENRQELIIFLLSVLLVMGRAIINFIVLSDKGKASLLLCLCLLLLVLGLHDVSLLHSIILGFGLFWACLKVVIGIMAILKELKALVWIFLLQNLPEVAYLIYLLYTVMNSWGAGKSYTLEAATLIGSCVSVMIKSVLFWALFHVYCSFGQGLRERMFSSYGRIDS